eukprot:m.170059 g.170059  ORF g.170059 m.170059 type:complete len:826 (+) comp16484_c3_seq1:65-2542(+)
MGKSPVLISATVLLASFLLASPLSRAQQCSEQTNVIIGADSISIVSASTAADCCNACNSNPDCVAFTLDTAAHQCYLKDNTRGETPQSNRVSGTNGRTPLNSFYACQGQFGSFPFCNTSASLEERINDLIDRVPLDIIGQQQTARESPEMINLGVPAYYWGTNAIHGMQNTDCLPDGQCPTSFPAPCGLAAAFNTSIVKDMGRIIGRELRAYYNYRFHNSLDTWSPTINPSRDPRWGRNVESPGEDPLVCGLFGQAYTEGLQYGDDDQYFQSIVTLKHWVAYSLENYDGVTRHTYNAIVSPYDLSDTYFPGWERTVRNAGAMGVMCSYNELNGAPTCGNPNLTSILRDDFGFQGYITSDSDAVADIYSSHKYEPTPELAVRDAINAGCDINSGNTYSDYLAKAINESLVDVEAVRACQFRAYKMRFQLGLFDPNVTTSYRSINISEVGQPSSQESSLLAARKTMTLLKNDNILPFQTGKTIAVLGVSANSSGDILGNYVGPICPDGTYNCVPTIYDGIKALNNGPTLLVDDPSQIQSAVAAAKQADYVVLLASNAADGGGEGQDRYNISLAADQKAFADAVLQVGKPTVLLSINGGLISLDDLKDTAPAILIAFMPGVHGGQAVAETIFGLNNPGGKLPVTMYPSNYVNEIDFLNMSMTTGPGRSYKYYTGTPLFPFGFGLSYTTFNLTWSPVPPSAGVRLSSAFDSRTFTCTVTNTGNKLGDEVVFAYYRPQSESIQSLPADNPVPLKVLFGFERVTLAPGQSTQIMFELNTTDLGLVDTDGHRSVHSGQYDIILSRGHGEELVTTVQVDLKTPHRLFTFRRWW